MLPSALLAVINSLPVLQKLGISKAARPADFVAQIENACEKGLGSTAAITHPAAYALLKGGLFYAVDALDAAHSIFQEDLSPEGSYWHGMLHRREGDFWNAKYWLQKAGRLGALKDFPEFDPIQFVTRCERAAQRSDAEDPEDLLALQRKEWEHLIQAAYEKAFRA